MNYNIGDTAYWVESSTHYNKKVPCPMCFGKRFVTLILGDESQTQIECGFCSHGIDRPSGLANSWEPSAIIHAGTITGISTRDGTRYEIGGRNLFAHELYTNEADAKLVQEVKLKEVQEQAEHCFRESFVNAKKKQIWSAGYHRSCIKSAERNIEWHRLRLNMIKDKPKEESGG